MYRGPLFDSYFFFLLISRRIFKQMLTILKVNLEHWYTDHTQYDLRLFSREDDDAIMHQPWSWQRHLSTSHKTGITRSEFTSHLLWIRFPSPYLPLTSFSYNIHRFMYSWEDVCKTHRYMFLMVWIEFQNRKPNRTDHVLVNQLVKKTNHQSRVKKLYISFSPTRLRIIGSGQRFALSD